MEKNNKNYNENIDIANKEPDSRNIYEKIGEKSNGESN